MLLPFRLESDPSAARNFVRNFFRSAYEGTRMYTGEALHQELRLTEPLVGPIAPTDAIWLRLLTLTGVVQHNQVVLE
jgi:hypothetical protein